MYVHEDLGGSCRVGGKLRNRINKRFKILKRKVFGVLTADKQNMRMNNVFKETLVLVEYEPLFDSPEGWFVIRANGQSFSLKKWWFLDTLLRIKS